jgi:hypothetical protein
MIMVPTSEEEVEVVPTAMSVDSSDAEHPLLLQTLQTNIVYTMCSKAIIGTSSNQIAMTAKKVNGDSCQEGSSSYFTDSQTKQPTTNKEKEKNRVSCPRLLLEYQEQEEEEDEDKRGETRESSRRPRSSSNKSKLSPRFDLENIQIITFPRVRPEDWSSVFYEDDEISEFRYQTFMEDLDRENHYHDLLLSSSSSD